MKIIEKIINFILPEKCISCGRRGNALCQSCMTKIAPANNTNLAWCQSVFSYKDPVIRKAIRNLKYRNRRGIAKVLAIKLHDFIFEDVAETKLFSENSKIILVPIPISAKRRRKRGYNQSALLAKAMAKLYPEIYSVREDLIRKIKDNIPQVETRTRRERLTNMDGVFATTGKINILDTIYLVDDVITTGTTLNEAKKTLRLNGVRNIRAITVAH